MSAPVPSQIPQIRSALRFFKISSYVTGVFLLLLMITWGIRRLPFLGYDLWLGGPNGAVSFESYGVDGEGLPNVGVNLTVWILIIHGWLYVIYLIASFRLWAAARWPLRYLVILSLGGVIPVYAFLLKGRIVRKAMAFESQSGNFPEGMGGERDAKS